MAGGIISMMTTIVITTTMAVVHMTFGLALYATGSAAHCVGIAVVATANTTATSTIRSHALTLLQHGATISVVDILLGQH